MEGVDAIEALRLEPVPHESSTHLGCIAVPPVRDADPVPELGTVVLTFEAQTDRADERAVLPPLDGERERILRGLARDPFLSGSVGIGVWDHERPRRDLAGAGEALNLDGVGEAERTEHEPLGLEPHGSVARSAFRCSRSSSSLICSPSSRARAANRCASWVLPAIELARARASNAYGRSQSSSSCGFDSQ
jgi:hypothetical protein